MTKRSELVRAGRVGRPHGLDGSFYVDGPAEPLAEGVEVTVGDLRTVVERCGGTEARPLIRLRDVGDRAAAGALTGLELLVEAGTLGQGEYLASDLVGCEVPRIGRVRRVVASPSCDILEVGEGGFLIPLVSDAISSIDTEARIIEVDRRFLGLDRDGA